MVSIDTEGLEEEEGGSALLQATGYNSPRSLLGLL